MVTKGHYRLLKVLDMVCGAKVLVQIWVTWGNKINIDWFRNTYLLWNRLLYVITYYYRFTVYFKFKCLAVSDKVSSKVSSSRSKTNPKIKFKMEMEEKNVGCTDGKTQSELNLMSNFFQKNKSWCRTEETKEFFLGMPGC